MDVHRFAALVEAARRTGDPQPAVETYARALSMWRGDPLVDFAGAAWTLVEAGRLAESRLAAIAERADAVPILTEAIEVAAAAGVDNTAQWATADLGLAYLALGRLDEASACFAPPEPSPIKSGTTPAASSASTPKRCSPPRTANTPAQDRSLTMRTGFEGLGVWLATGLALAGLADCHLRTGDVDAAREGFSELRLTRRHHRRDRAALPRPGRNSPDHRRSGRPCRREMLAHAASLRTRYDRPASTWEKEAALATDAAARIALGDSGYQTAVQRGATRALGSSPVQ